MFLQALPIPPMFAGMCSDELSAQDLPQQQREPQEPQQEEHEADLDYSEITSASPTNPLGKKKSEEHQVSIVLF